MTLLYLEKPKIKLFLKQKEHYAVHIIEKSDVSVQLPPWCRGSIPASHAGGPWFETRHFQIFRDLFNVSLSSANSGRMDFSN